MDETAFVAVCADGALPEGELLAFAVPGHVDPARVLVNLGGELRAVSGVCPHRGADLSEGVLKKGALVCPYHGSAFDCLTGAAVHPPAVDALTVYPVRVEAGTVYVGVEP